VKISDASVKMMKNLLLYARRKLMYDTIDPIVRSSLSRESISCDEEATAGTNSTKLGAPPL
jgi:hypothetical protein